MTTDFVSVQEKYAAELIDIDTATERFFGPTVSPFSVRRWIAKGVGVPPVKLKSIRLGGRYFLRAVDIQEFIEAAQNPELYRRRQKTARVEKAKRKLQRAGA